MRIKRAYPGSLYDTAGVEKWLRELEAEGLRLEEFSVYGGLGKFRQDEPRLVRFYIELDFDQYTSEEAVKAYREQGWKFVCELRNVFLVYETEDPMVLKPPARKPTEKQLKKKLRSLWSDLILWLVGLPLTLTSLYGVVSIDHLFDLRSLRVMILLVMATGTLLAEEILMGLGKRNDIRVWKQTLLYHEEVDPQPAMSTLRHIQYWGVIVLLTVTFVALIVAAICL